MEIAYSIFIHWWAFLALLFASAQFLMFLLVAVTYTQFLELLPQPKATHIIIVTKTMY